jgi:GNAT superfamily N-acetyltransferase
MSGAITFGILPDALLPLVDKFYRSHRSPMRAVKGATVWVAKQQEIICTLSLSAVADGHWLTGLFVAPQWRGQAVAGRLLAEVLQARAGPVWLFCHPELEGFYQRAGFAECGDLPGGLADRLRRYGRTKPLIAMCAA